MILLPTSLKNKTILIAPLNWGLGHAARCVPIIKTLIKEENRVIICSDGEALDLLRKEFPNLESHEIPAYDIRYPYSYMPINMLLQSPKIWRVKNMEKKAAARIVKETNADIIISDNRFGFRAEGVLNIYITHQLRVPSGNPLSENFATRIHRSIIKQFDQCWVPDNKGENSLAGKLSQQTLGIPTYYIGPLSRMTSEVKDKIYDICIILSGPEPQRTMLENKLAAIYLNQKDKKVCIIRGTNKGKSEIDVAHIDTHNLLSTKELNDIINTSEHIICRAGYTSIMDLVSLGKEATLIPTPGQYEQLYLANRLNGKYGFKAVLQKDLGNT